MFWREIVQTNPKTRNFNTIDLPLNIHVLTVTNTSCFIDFLVFKAEWRLLNVLNIHLSDWLWSTTLTFNIEWVKPT